MARKHKSESSSAQRGSGISNLEERTERTERTSPTNLQCAPAQLDSKMSNRGMGLMSPMGSIGLMGKLSSRQFLRHSAGAFACVE